MSSESDHRILATVIQRIEEEYFAANPDWLIPRSPFSHLLVEAGVVDPSTNPSFKSVVHQFPPKCKALIMGFNSAPAEQRKRNGPPKKTNDEIEARWHSMDPVDMESVERDHFLKTKQVLRTRHVEAMPSPMRPGSRLSQVLGMDFLEALPALSIEDFVCLASSLLSAPKNGLFHRDLKQDAQFVISKRIMQFSNEEVGRFIVPLSLVVSRFETNLEIPNRVWARKLVPVIRQKLCQVEIVPQQYSHLNSVSRWALLSATVIGSGRLPVTARLMSYLMPKVMADVGGIDSSIAGRLADSLVTSGFHHKTLLTSFTENAASLSIESCVRLVHARNHFGQFGSDFDRLVDVLRSKIEASPSDIDLWSPSSKLMLLNCVFASASETQSEAVLRLTKSVCARLPDFEIESLGRIDSLLE